LTIVESILELQHCNNCNSECRAKLQKMPISSGKWMGLISKRKEFFYYLSPLEKLLSLEKTQFFFGFSFDLHYLCRR